MFTFIIFFCAGPVNMFGKRTIGLTREAETVFTVDPVKHLL